MLEVLQRFDGEIQADQPSGADQRAGYLTIPTARLEHTQTLAVSEQRLDRVLLLNVVGLPLQGHLRRSACDGAVPEVHLLVLEVGQLLRLEQAGDAVREGIVVGAAWADQGSYLQNRPGFALGSGDSEGMPVAVGTAQPLQQIRFHSRSQLRSFIFVAYRRP